MFRNHGRPRATLLKVYWPGVCVHGTPQAHYCERCEIASERAS
jgi:hypothetical protein